MATQYANGKIVTNGLVLALDAADRNSYDLKENIVTYSNDLTSGGGRPWSYSNLTVTASAAVAPDGTTSASKITEISSSATHENLANNTGYGGDTFQTVSAYVKPAGRNYCYLRLSGNSKRAIASFDLVTGQVNCTQYGSTSADTSATIENIGNGWWRVSVTARSTYTPIAPGWSNFSISPSDVFLTSSVNFGGSGYLYQGDGTSGIFVWGVQSERKANVTPLTQTNGTAINQSSTWIDLSNSTGNGSLLSSGSNQFNPTYSGSNGGSFLFSGFNNYISTNNPIPPSSSFAISVWLQYSIPGADTFRDIINTRESGSNIGFLLTTDFSSRNGKIRVQLNSSGSINQFVSTGSNNIADNTPKNVIINVDRSINTMTYYVNGGLDASFNISAVGNISSSNTFDIGRNVAFNDPKAWFTGSIYSVQVYNRALSASEIAQNYNAQKSRFNL
jgi:hypothetical protein